MAAVGGAGAMGGAGTLAFFSDEETFANDTLIAGELDAKVGYSAHYSDWSPDEDGSDTEAPGDDVDVVMWDGTPDTTGSSDDPPVDGGYTGLPTNEAWLVAVDDPDQFLANTQYAADGDASCPDGTDADDIEQPVIDLEDVKPGDFGEVTIDFALCDNPGFVWLRGDLRSAAENGLTDPEADDDDEDGDAGSTDPADVELLDAVQAAVWVDDGDNYQDEEVLTISGSLRTVLDELRAGPGLALGGNVESGDALGRDCFSHDRDDTGGADVHSVSFAWWLPVDHANEIQTDSVTFDLGLYTEQCRHNEGTAVELDELVTTPEMQQLLTDLGHPAPSDPTVEDFGSLGPVELEFDQARTRAVEPGEEFDAVPDAEELLTTFVTVIPSPVGELTIPSTSDGGVGIPTFEFDDSTPESVRSRSDLGGDVGWPGGMGATLGVVRVPERAGSGRAVVTASSGDTGTVLRFFSREVDAEERESITDEIGSEPTSARALNVSLGPFSTSLYVALTESATPGVEVAGTDGGPESCDLPTAMCRVSNRYQGHVLDPEVNTISSNALSREKLEPLVAQLEEESSPVCTNSVRPRGRNPCDVSSLELSSCLERRSEGSAALYGLCVAAATLIAGAGPYGPVAAGAFLTVCTATILLATRSRRERIKRLCCLGCETEIEDPEEPTPTPEPTPMTFELDPKGTFLRADFDPPPPRIIDLSEVGLSPGDEITIKQSGDTTSTPSGPERRHSTIAVFSASDTLLDPSKKNRVPDAIDVRPDADTPRTFFGNESTNIPEDFRVANFDGSESSVTVTIPSGATHLFIGIEDSEPTDNVDRDDDYRVTITPN